MQKYIVKDSKYCVRGNNRVLWEILNKLLLWQVRQVFLKEIVFWKEEAAMRKSEELDSEKR